MPVAAVVGYGNDETGKQLVSVHARTEAPLLVICIHTHTLKYSQSISAHMFSKLSFQSSQIVHPRLCRLAAPATRDVVDCLGDVCDCLVGVYCRNDDLQGERDDWWNRMKNQP